MSTEQNLKMSKTKIFDIKGTSLLTAMASERMSLTCAPGGENHAGMEIIGRMPVKGEGFKAVILKGWLPILKIKLKYGYGKMVLKQFQY